MRLYGEVALLVLLTAAALALGFMGFARVYPGMSFLDVLYRDLQLFTLESGAVDGAVPWQLEVARVLAPAVAAWAIVRTIMYALRERFRRASILFYRDHVVVCGLGRAGAEFVRDLRNRHRKVVAIEQDENRDTVHACRQAGVVVLIGDATSERVLRSAGLKRAAAVIGVCGDDGANIELALTLQKLMNKRRERPLLCFLHMQDFALASLFKTHGILTRPDDGLDVQVFNLYENAARALFYAHPLDYEPITPEDPRTVHLVVLGFGQMGESVAVQAAKIGHFANEKKLRITVFDRDANARRESFHVRYPNIDAVCDIEFRQAEFDITETMEAIERIVRDPDALPTVALCFDNDSRNLQYALTLRERLRGAASPLRVRISEDTGVAQLVQHAKNDEAIDCFGMVDTLCRWELLRDQTLDALARMIHERYVEQRLKEGTPEDDESVQPWGRLDPGLKDSNRQQADHIPVKLRALGYDYDAIQSGAEPPPVFDDREVEILAKMEHARWNAERFLSGWTLGDKDVEKKRSPYLVPYHELEDRIQEYDRQAVREIGPLLKAVTDKE